MKKNAPERLNWERNKRERSIKNENFFPRVLPMIPNFLFSSDSIC